MLKKRSHLPYQLFSAVTKMYLLRTSAVFFFVFLVVQGHNIGRIEVRERIPSVLGLIGQPVVGGGVRGALYGGYEKDRVVSQHGSIGVDAGAGVRVGVVGGNGNGQVVHGQGGHGQVGNWNDINGQVGNWQDIGQDGNWQGGNGQVGNVGVVQKHGFVPGSKVVGSGLVAEQSSQRLLASQDSGSLAANSGSNFYNADDVNRVSSLKTSSSTSNKTVKRKNNSNFEGDSLNLNQQGVAASQSNQLNLAQGEQFAVGANVGKVFGVNVSGSKNSALNAANTNSLQANNLNINSSHIRGSSNSEVEESESNSNTQSENVDVGQNSHFNAGSQYANLNQNYDRRNVAVGNNQSVVSAFQR